ncbi:MAG: regulatory signaling modulator protein AmpE [Gammaproteobacteria bacterium]|nr:regulatory signaling modulator protein AmpE [Gammaproteobacteria bacterium]
MKFLAILIGVAMELYVLRLQQWRQFSWFSRYTDAMLRLMQSLTSREGPLGVLLVILPPVIVISALQFGLDYQYYVNKLWVIFELGFSTLLLVYCMGPRDPIRMVDEYINAMERGDVRAAQAQVEQLLGRIVTEPVEDYAPRLKEILLLRVNDNIIGPLFWFVLIGPVGALLFRLSCELEMRFGHMTGGFTAASKDLYRIVSWLPARICALGYAFAGSFVDTIANWQRVSDLWSIDNEKFLIRSGLGAVGDIHDEDEDFSALQSLANVLALVKRTVLILLVLLAVMIIVGLITG